MRGNPAPAVSRTAPPAGYPRVCGGTPSRAGHWRSEVGLSPRVRGNLRPSRGLPAWSRAIPACAGEPGTGGQAAIPAPGYPRVCGGTGSSDDAADWQPALSPRVRGNLRQPVGYGSLPRAIPACAGEPAAKAKASLPPTCYPRVCGGTRSRPLPGTHTGLLSPRVRGNPAIPVDAGRTARSIPACAGEPKAVGKPFVLEAVYPRVCGGTADLANYYTRAFGLSPRVRGNLSQTLNSTANIRSIPACAGEPPPCATIDRELGVYPRVCGGTPTYQFSSARLSGLSPRVRGNPTH